MIFAVKFEKILFDKTVIIYFLLFINIMKLLILRKIK